MKMWKKFALLTLLITQLSTVYAETGTNNKIDTQKKGEYSINFDSNKYTVKTLTINGQTIKYRAFENIIYVKNPIDIKYEVMNFYVPEAYYEGKSIGNFTSKTAPIFLPNMVGGYMPAEPGTIGTNRDGTGPNAEFVALMKGYVVAEPGARGRTTKDANGKYTGKAPADIVDLKAAVRYLHFNDNVMVGDAEKIISNGTSAGGAMSVLIGATGNNKDYESYLKEIGAADSRDDIFAVSAYCPITNLDHADMAYEWLFNGVNSYKRMEFKGMIDFKVERTFVEGTMTEEQIKLSKKLSALFPEYINSLGLKNNDGTLLTLDANGNGSFKTHVKSFIIASAQKALDNKTDLSGLTWITIKNKTVTDIDFDSYVKYVGRMKTTPAFDNVDLSSGENDLFGTADIQAQHFTEFGNNNSTVKGSLADSKIVKMMNPLNYIGTKGTTVSKYWRIRHGGIDSDTSVAVSSVLATTLKNKGFDVDYAVPWGVPHSGDYDLDELFAWMDKITK